MSTYFSFGEINADDFSPVKISELPLPLDELSEPRLRKYVAELRLAVTREQVWQHETGYQDPARLIQIAELYLEAQAYYAEFDPKLKERINGPDYKPVLRLDGRVW